MKDWKNLNNLKWGALILIISAITVMLGDSRAWAERVAVNVPEAKVRSGPGVNYDVLWRAQQYTPLEVLDKDKTGEWFFFKDFEGDKAWINKSLVSKMETVIINQAKKETYEIRKEPNSKSEVIFKAEKGVPFKVIKRQKDWIQVQHADGNIGWIHKDLVW